MIEQWRKLIYDGIVSDDYSVSNLGNIRNDRTGKTLKLQSTGYLHVRIKHGEKQRNIRVHRAVASTFLLSAEGLTVVNHINGNKTDNRVSNLEWTTQSNNVLSSLKLRGGLIDG